MHFALPARRAFAAGLGHGDGVEGFFEFGFGEDLHLAADFADGLPRLGALLGDLGGSSAPRAFQSAEDSYSRVMSLTDLKTAVDQLPPAELAELAAFVREREAAVWDRQIETDSKAGKFDTLRTKVRADYEAGKCEDL